MDDPIATSEDVNQVYGMLSGPEMERALEALDSMIPDPIAVLREHGVQIPEDADVTMTLKPTGKGKPVRERCWEVCVRKKGIEICYEKCKRY